MTSHYFSGPLADLHYYKFGNGPKTMFCFHGYGMHGKQFRVLEQTLGNTYSFYGFDLFFHKETKLKDQTLEAIKRGISKRQLADFFISFCAECGIEQFSVIAYSMGSHYATSLVETIPEYIEELFIAAPSSLKPGKIITFLSTNRIGNKVLERLALSDNGMTNLLSLLKKVRVIDQKAYDILFSEVSRADLRFSFYACAVYMRSLTINPARFIQSINTHKIKSTFIYGKRDRNYPPTIGNSVIRKIKSARQIIIDENHDMINRNFANVLFELINDN